MRRVSKRQIRENTIKTDFKKYFGQEFAFLKKVGFPINMSRIVKYKKTK